jgi:hypothetical protein
MATVYITEFIGREFRGIQAWVTPPVAEQTIAIGGVSVQSAAFNPTTEMIRVHADAICSIAFGFNPTATAVNMRMPAGIVECFVVYPGTKLAVITNV